MKRITIQKALEEYDSNKGYGRTLLKEEPHIKELRSFYEELTEDNLSSSSLLKLALILIGKNTRTDTTESGKTFKGLVNRLGGYEALDILNAAHQITEDNVAFLEKHPTKAKALAPIVVSISKNTKISFVKKIFCAMEKMKKPQELIAVFEELELMSRTENSHFFIDALSLLNKHNLNSDEVIPLLKETEHIIIIHKILETLAERNPSLITLPNLINILKIKKIHTFHGLFKNLPPDQKSLDRLFQTNDTLAQSYWCKDILINFKEAGWDPHPFLETILGKEINGLELKRAITKLIELKLKPERLPLILHTLVTHSNESTIVMDAVETLHKEGLDEHFLKLTFEVPQFSNKVATAFVTLQKEQCYNATTQVYVCSNPEYAADLAQFWVQFSKVECVNQTPRETMLQQPQCAAYTAEVIEFLRQHKHHSEKNIIAICNAKLTSNTLLNMLKIMNEAKILDQTSLNMLLPRLSFIKTLYSGIQCLAYGEKLDSFNFDTLISDPVNAVALAENLGGKSYPTGNNFLKNRGAQDFITILRNTQILCQGHQKGLFFPEMSAKQQRDIKKEGHIEAQKEILVKIAQHSGNGELEKETEHNIAQESYSSFFNT
ncbi:hypothetical protein [Legionella fallonii]|uniref:Uncharacterized protein n=1 Tax=Legionella fallonii LLAP-10 TaxID=1212491 RepID=A0A098G9M8_9GAMM|nr:hypothetical protein [Legionella fallonii]CEG58700.1 protein of unknown function [Legionella fallonii LLAP-10]